MRYQAWKARKVFRVNFVGPPKVAQAATHQIMLDQVAGLFLQVPEPIYASPDPTIEACMQSARNHVVLIKLHKTLSSCTPMRADSMRRVRRIDPN